MAWGGRFGDGGAAPLPADDASQTVLAHQPLDGAAGRNNAFAPQSAVYAPGSVSLTGGGVDAAEVLNEFFIAPPAGGFRALAAGVACRDRQVQFPAYELDPDVVAEVADHRVGLVRG
nr:hypothetical protein [Streptomyces halobius]